MFYPCFALTTSALAFEENPSKATAAKMKALINAVKNYILVSEWHELEGDDVDGTAEARGFLDELVSGTTGSEISAISGDETAGK